MNSIQNENQSQNCLVRSQNQVAPKKTYQKPLAITFGSVAGLTHGTHSVGNDGVLGFTKNGRGDHGGGHGHHGHH